MSPFFSLVNKSSYELEVGEVSNHASTRWHYVSSAEVTLTKAVLVGMVAAAFCYLGAPSLFCLLF